MGEIRERGEIGVDGGGVGKFLVPKCQPEVSCPDKAKGFLTM